MTNHYETLGVRHDASTKKIKAAYLKLALKLHPDKNNGKGEYFKEVSAAYAILSDAEKRKAYDRDLNNDQEEETFTCANNENAEGNSQALVVPATFSFAETLNRAQLSAEEFIDLAEDNLDIAKKAFTDPECQKIIAGPNLNSHLLSLAWPHEELAQYVVKNNELWAKLTSDPTLLSLYAYKHPFICRIVFADPVLVDTLFTSSLINLKNKHKLELTFNNAEALAKINSRLEAYRQLDAMPIPPVNSNVRWFVCIELVNLATKAKLKPQELTELAKKNEHLALGCVHEQPTFERLKKSAMVDFVEIALKHESVAIMMMANHWGWEHLATHPTAIRELATLYPDTVGNLVLQTQAIRATLSVSDLSSVLSAFRFRGPNFAPPPVLNSPGELAKLNVYQRLYSTNQPAPEPQELFELVNSAQITPKDFFHAIRGNFALARIMMKNQELYAWFTQDEQNFDLLCQLALDTNSTDIPMFILDNRHIWSKLANQPAKIVALAKAYPTAAKKALANPELIKCFSGGDLLELTGTHGLFLEDNVAKAKLQAYVLLRNASRQQHGLVIHKKPRNQITDLDEENEIYQLGLTYQTLSVNPGQYRQADQLARECFYQAASRGHKLALKKLLEYTGNRYPITEFEIAEIYLNPDFEMCNNKTAAAWANKMFAHLDGYKAKKLLEHMINKIETIKEDDYFPELANFYLTTLLHIAPTCESLKMTGYSSACQRIAAALETLDSDRALAFYSLTPASRLTPMELQKMANMASTALWNRQLVAALNVLALPHTEEKINAILNEPSKIAQRIVAALRYLFNAMVKDPTDKTLSKAVENMLKQLSDLRLNGADNDLKNILPYVDQIKLFPSCYHQHLYSLLFDAEAFKQEIKRVADIQHELQNLKELVKKLPAQHKTIRTKIADLDGKALLDDNTLIIKYTAKINAIKKYHQELKKLRIRARALPNRFDAITTNLANLMQQDNVNVNMLIDVTKNLDALEKAFRQLARVKNKINPLPIQYTVIRNKAADLTIKSTGDLSEINTLKIQVNRLLSFADKAHAQKAAMNDLTAALTTLETKLSKKLTKNEAVQYRTVRTLRHALQKNINAHFNQDFSDPAATTHAVFQASCIKLIEDHLEKPNSGMKNTTGLLIQLAAWLARQLKRIFPHSPRVNEWVKSTSAHFKVAPVEGKKIRQQIGVILR